jgi:hypothetical protein
MLIKLKANIPEIILGVLLAVAIFAMGMTFQSSRTPLTSNNAQQSADQRGSPPTPEYSADKATDWLLVGLNLFLVGSTLLLWRANNRSAKIAERALTDLERAYVFIDEIKSNILSYLSPNTVWNPDRSGPGFHFSIINYGRTSANVTITIISFEVLAEIPPEIIIPAFDVAAASADAHDIEIIIGSDRPYTFPGQACREPFTREHANRLRAGTATLYCHGAFTYLDVLKKLHPAKFCRRYDVRRDEWVPAGGRQRNSYD